jgi:hypothetical protein
MSSRKPKQDTEYLIEWETAQGSLGPQLQLVEAVPSQKAPAAKPVWGASSDLIVDLGGRKPRSTLH